jgi:plasmid maintenance system antidote protein VapI
MKDKNLKEQMSKNLKRIMADRQISDKVLADIIGTDTARVSKLLSGQCAMTSEQVFHLAQKLQISTDVIYGITTEKEQMHRFLLSELRLPINEYTFKLIRNNVENLKRLANTKR